MAGLDTYSLCLDLPVWSNLLPFNANSSNPATALFTMGLSTRSLDTYLQTIPITKNGVLALIEGNSGMMLAASTPNISVDWPVQYPAVGNPNGLVSAAAYEISKRFSALDPAVNGTAAIGAIADTVQSNFDFGYGGDTIYCSTAWIASSTTDLSLLLILVIPSGDFLGE
ncbi:hypothetical protein HK405_010953, partial [Cladochytrium tenue]